MVNWSKYVTLQSCKTNTLFSERIDSQIDRFRARHDTPQFWKSLQIMFSFHVYFSWHGFGMNPTSIWKTANTEGKLWLSKGPTLKSIDFELRHDNPPL